MNILNKPTTTFYIPTMTRTGSKFKFDPPMGDELPSRGFDAGEDTFQPPPKDGSGIDVVVDVDSKRLQLLTPFDSWDGEDYENLRVLIKVNFPYIYNVYYIYIGCISLYKSLVYFLIIYNSQNRFLAVFSNLDFFNSYRIDIILCSSSIVICINLTEQY